MYSRGFLSVKGACEVDQRSDQQAQTRLIDAAQIVGGFLFPCYLNYNSQLRARRLFRKHIEKQRARSAAALEASGSQSGAAEGVNHRAETRDRGLDIRPNWKLHLPEGVAFVVLSYVAGQNHQLLQYMV